MKVVISVEDIMRPWGVQHNIYDWFKEMQRGFSYEISGLLWHISVFQPVSFVPFTSLTFPKLIEGQRYSKLHRLVPKVMMYSMNRLLCFPYIYIYIYIYIYLKIWYEEANYMSVTFMFKIQVITQYKCSLFFYRFFPQVHFKNFKDAYYRGQFPRSNQQTLKLKWTNIYIYIILYICI